MMCGHTDTSDWNSDAFRRDQWRYDPFGAEIDGGLIYGLGALNMKAGLASMQIAAGAIRRSGAPLKGDLIAACVVAETGGVVGALHLIESGCCPEYFIVTEAGNLDRDYAVVQAGVLVAAVAFVAVNLLADLAYAIIDPRTIRRGRG